MLKWQKRTNKLHMNTTFLIGNGFDIALGLNTCYSAFHEYYTNLPSSRDCIDKLKTNIRQNLETWADFEKKFGEYTANMESITEFDMVYEDILEHMNTFIKREYQNFLSASKEKTFDITTIIQHFHIPYQFVRMRLALQRIFSSHANSDINIINFNYTPTIDKLIEEIRESKEYKSNNNVRFQPPLHIHGKLDQPLLFGLNDKNQIANSKFQEEDQIVNDVVKPVFNNRLGSDIPSKCKEIIKNSRLICIYGMSLGETDACWWNLIGKCINENSNLVVILFYWDKKEFIPLYEKNKMRHEDSIKDWFMQKIGIQKGSSPENRIFVGYKTELFQNILK